MNNAEMGHMPEQDISEIQQQPPTLSRRKALGLGLSALGASFLIACGVKPGEKPEPTTVTGTTVPVEPTPRTTPTSSATLSPGGEGKFPTPTATSTPEVKKGFDCGILSPEACASGEYIQWIGPIGTKVEGMGFVLKEGEKIIIPENLQVVDVGEFPKPNTYNGREITGVSKDGREFIFIGRIVPSKELNLTDVGKDLPAGTVIGTIGALGEPVFKEAPYNMIFISPDNGKSSFTDQTSKPPKVINNTLIMGDPGKGGTFFDIKPPRK